jgi:hypothetical protein
MFDDAYAGLRGIITTLGSKKEERIIRLLGKNLFTAGISTRTATTF